MTFTEAKKQIRDLNMTIRRTDYDDYRVNFPNGPESFAYYTNDLADAVQTAARMRQTPAAELALRLYGGSRIAGATLVSLTETPLYPEKQ